MVVVVIIVVIVLIVLFVFISNAEPESNSKSTPIGAKRKASATPKSKKIDLEGVWFNDEGRQEAFAEVAEGDSVTITFDYGNQHDKNALGVYTQTGKLLGYIPKGKQGIIKAFRTEPKRVAIIVNKTNGSTQWDKGIKIELTL